MRASVIRIGNSRGVRIPKALLEEAGIGQVVELSLEQGRLVLAPVRASRAGWAEAARRMADRDEDRLLDPPVATDFDQRDWEW